MTSALDRTRRCLGASERRVLGAALAFAVSLLCACSSENTAPSGTGGVVGAAGGSEGVGGSSVGGASSGGAGGSVSTGGAQTVGGASSGGVAASDGGATAVGGSGGAASGGASGQTGGGAAFLLTSPAFEDVEGCSVENSSVCDVFPDENVSYLENANISPELHWTGAPPGTESFALVLTDVSFGQAHWVLWNIPGDATTLAADVQQDTATPPVPAGSQQTNANFATTSEDGYFGPHMQCNVYAFELYALSTSTFSPMRPESSVLVSIELLDLDSVLGVAKLTGRGNMPSCE